jgi:hypothetical protein
MRWMLLVTLVYMQTNYWALAIAKNLNMNVPYIYNTCLDTKSWMHRRILATSKPIVVATE